MVQRLFVPDFAHHPGVTLAEKIEETGMQVKELAIRSGRTEQNIIDIVNGRQSITPDTALRFEDVFGIPAHFWLNK